MAASIGRRIPSPPIRGRRKNGGIKAVGRVKGCVAEKTATEGRGVLSGGASTTILARIGDKKNRVGTAVVGGNAEMASSVSLIQQKKGIKKSSYR